MLPPTSIDLPEDIMIQIISSQDTVLIKDTSIHDLSSSGVYPVSLRSKLILLNRTFNVTTKAVRSYFNPA